MVVTRHKWPQPMRQDSGQRTCALPQPELPSITPRGGLRCTSTGRPPQHQCGTRACGGLLGREDELGSELHAELSWCLSITVKIHDCLSFSTIAAIAVIVTMVVGVVVTCLKRAHVLSTDYPPSTVQTTYTPRLLSSSHQPLQEALFLEIGHQHRRSHSRWTEHRTGQS